MVRTTLPDGMPVTATLIVATFAESGKSALREAEGPAAKIAGDARSSNAGAMTRLRKNTR
jgi:hypothetical protein